MNDIDIVGRLRLIARDFPRPIASAALLNEAADEIERLRAGRAAQEDIGAPSDRDDKSDEQRRALWFETALNLIETLIARDDREVVTATENRIAWVCHHALRGDVAKMVREPEPRGEARTSLSSLTAEKENMRLADRDERSDERHTSERWTVIGDDAANLHVVQEGAEHLRICFLTSNGPTEQRARLIAAAPDLYAAIDGRDPEEPAVIKPLSWLRSLIDDARERGPAPDNDDPDAYQTMLQEVEDFHARCAAAIAKAEQSSAPRPEGTHP